MSNWLPSPAVAKVLAAIGWVAWMAVCVVTFVTDDNDPTLFAMVALLAGGLMLPLGPLAFLDIEGSGSDWARRTPGGRKLDADGQRRLARFVGIGWTVITAGWVLFASAFLLARALP